MIIPPVVARGSRNQLMPKAWERVRDRGQDRFALGTPLNAVARGSHGSGAGGSDGAPEAAPTLALRQAGVRRTLARPPCDDAPGQRPKVSIATACPVLQVQVHRPSDSRH